MNKFTKSVMFLSCGLMLSSCNHIFDMGDDYVGGDFGKLVQKEQEWSDSAKFVDNLGIEDTYDERMYSHRPENMDFTATGTINNISVHVRIECNGDGGNLVVFNCKTVENPQHMNDNGIMFSKLRGNKMTSRDGYTIRMLDSLNIGKETFRNVLEFDATKAEKNECDYDKFYISATQGLLRIDLMDTITIKRSLP